MLLARCLDRRDQGHEAFVADYTQAFLKAEVRDGVCSTTFDRNICLTS